MEDLVTDSADGTVILHPKVKYRTSVQVVELRRTASGRLQRECGTGKVNLKCRDRRTSVQVLKDSESELDVVATASGTGTSSAELERSSSS